MTRKQAIRKLGELGWIFLRNDGSLVLYSILPLMKSIILIGLLGHPR